MPVVNLLVDSSAGHKILSMMDGHSGYNQICIVDENIHKTAFRCPGNIRTFKWVKMPFWLKNIRAIYQRAMNTIFHDLIGGYIDDIFTKSQSMEEHLVHLTAAFENLVKYMFSRPILRGRIDIWILALSEFHLEYVPQKAIKGQIKPEVIDFIKELIYRFGIPQTITVDSGTMFDGKLVKTFIAEYRISLVDSIRYYAQTNARAESSNKSLKNGIQQVVEDNPRD
ncbi:uncharacterized protein LOC114270506 [Camellia sinensis]|uniref:uncharacterized protein LOC114270506 n=1 Tax=Camellia sinensis TaxID=4442 RepID=UPI0010368882|nr:uncharacterized protein LOC114270506 [Camellia sinensis]